MNNIATFFRESRVARFLIPFGIILITLSIILFVIDSKNKDYIEVEATISKTELVKEETHDIDGNIEPAEYKTYVKYMIDGKEYENELGQMYKRNIGEKIKIVYNPENPNEISQPTSLILNIAILVGGVSALVGGFISAINALKRHKKMKEQERTWSNDN